MGNSVRKRFHFQNIYFLDYSKSLTSLTCEVFWKRTIRVSTNRDSQRTTCSSRMGHVTSRCVSHCIKMTTIFLEWVMLPN